MGLSDAKVQVICVGFIALACPGLFNALNGLGAAGGENADYANAANTALYCCFAVFGYFGGAFFNWFGPRILLGVGGFTYALYALGVWLSGNYENAGWVSPLVGAILGVGAGLFWTAQGAIALGYSTPANRGEYIGIFWIIFNLGGTAGGLIQFGINYNTDIAKANTASYFTFIALILLAVILVPFIIVNPAKVKRADGAQVVFERNTDVFAEVKGAALVITNKYMLLLLVYFIGSNWFYTYQFNFANGSLFNVRTRGLNSAFYWGSQMFAAWIMGMVVDAKNQTRRQRAFWGWFFCTILFAIAWSFGAWVQYGFEDGYDKDWTVAEHAVDGFMDFKDSSRASLPIITYILWGLADATFQAYAYWIMGAIAGDDTKLAARFSGYYKGVQSAGAAVAWGIDLSPNILYATQYWLGFGFWAVGSILAYVCVRSVVNDVLAPAILQKSISVLNSIGEGAAEMANARRASDTVKKTGSMEVIAQQKPPAVPAVTQSSQTTEIVVPGKSESIPTAAPQV